MTISTAIVRSLAALERLREAEHEVADLERDPVPHPRLEFARAAREEAKYRVKATEASLVLAIREALSGQ